MPACWNKWTIKYLLSASWAISIFRLNKLQKTPRTLAQENQPHEPISSTLKEDDVLTRLEFSRSFPFVSSQWLLFAALGAACSQHQKHSCSQNLWSFGAWRAPEADVTSARRTTKLQHQRCGTKSQGPIKLKWKQSRHIGHKNLLRRLSSVAFASQQQQPPPPPYSRPVQVLISQLSDMCKQSLIDDDLLTEKHWKCVWGSRAAGKKNKSSSLRFLYELNTDN